RGLIAAFGVRLTVEGLENLPAEGCIMVFNHSSHFDIFALAAGITKSSRFGAKIELFKIPVFNWAMRTVEVLPIRRRQRDQVLKLYEDSVPRVHSGESFYLAGEGSRQPTDQVGEKFKSGPFIFAID